MKETCIRKRDHIRKGTSTHSNLLQCPKFVTKFEYCRMSHTGLLTTNTRHYWMKQQADKVIQSEHTQQCHIYTWKHTTQLSEVSLYPVYIWWHSWIDSRKSFWTTPNSWWYNTNQNVNTTFLYHKWPSRVTLWSSKTHVQTTHRPYGLNYMSVDKLHDRLPVSVLATANVITHTVFQKVPCCAVYLKQLCLSLTLQHMRIFVFTNDINNAKQ